MSDLPDNLGEPAWMIAATTRATMAALEAAGGEGCARYVGGCVRNTLTGHPVDDIDIATILTPEAVIEAAKAAGLKAVPTGVEHGTVTVVASGKPFEVTTLRRDVSTDGRRAVVAFTDDWNEDAQRRDFRFNALYADGTGRIFDPTGAGVADAVARRVVFVGDAITRIREDYLRILRYFRFLAWYGEGELDPEAVVACASERDMLADRPGERISKELLKLLAAPDPRRAMRLMAEAGVLQVVMPFPIQLARFETMVDIDSDPELRLAALLPDEDAETALAVAERLRLSNAQRDRLIAAAGARLYSMGAAEARRLIYRLGPRTFSDKARLAWAATGVVDSVEWKAIAGAPEGWVVPSFPITGADALAAGLPKGPKLGQALRAIEDGWVAGDFAEGREALLARLRGLA
ncbi:MAG: CCA tRNA nucleotidyltransferase [Caulobacterales bacterium]|nr:CCA tRNA nucleotidyltransferase [Caulobacterales bacterium]